MMRNKIIAISLIAIILVSFLALPIDTRAKTIAQFEEEVKKYTQELQEKKDKIATNEQEIRKIKNKIAEIERTIATTEEEINSLQQEIEECEKEIAEKSEESKNIISYYQISNGENAYLEYAFGAEDITDMIYRLSIVEQLTEYNDKIMKELEALVQKNEEKKAQLEQKKKELKSLRKEYENQISRIEIDIKSIKAGMPDIEQQLSAAKAQLSYAKNLGCGQTEDITACIYRVNQRNNSGGASVPSTNGFYRPMEYGYITQYYLGCGNFIESWGICSGHTGIDLSSSNKSITIYPIASGLVTAKYYDNAGALVLKIKHNYNGQYLYSTYAHLRSWYVNIGQYVTENTALGQMGSTGNSTGPHLHLEISTCDWKSQGGGCTWRSYAKTATMNPRDFVTIPSSWNNR